jgi:hypothetical protein
MTEANQDKAETSDELEAVEVKPRTNRGAVVSVRLASDEAQKVARRAEKAGLSLSEFARRLLRRSITTSWKIMVWDAQAPVVFRTPPQTGGDYVLPSDEANVELSGRN